MFCCFKTLFYSAGPISRYSPQVDAKKQERLRSDIYFGRENLRLIGIHETGESMEAEEEDCEVIVRDILRDMGITRETAGFHAVHRVGPIRRGPDGKPS